MKMDARIVNEIRHGAMIADQPGRIWNWESPAGKRRWRRRVAMLSAGIRPDMRVLELGCGTGYYTRELLLTGATICAIDISPDLLQLARAGISSERVSFVEANAYAMDFADACFDTVVGSSVLHHLDIDKALPELFRVVRPGGLIAFTEPNMLNPQIMLQKNIPWIKARLGDSPDETAFFAGQLQRALARQGFTDIRIEPFDFLHPAIPAVAVPVCERIGHWLEATPGVRAIAGSLFIRAIR